MSGQLLQDQEGAQSTEVREMQNCENWADDGTLPIIVNHIVDENSYLTHQSALIPVNNLDELTIAEDNGQIFSIQNQIQAYQSSENFRANLTFAYSRPTSRNNGSRIRIGNYRANHGQHKLLKSFISLC